MSKRPEPEEVFHYTDAAGFLAITRSRTLWASCLECLNDEKEFRHGMDLAGQLCTRFVKGNPTEKLRWDSFVDVLGRLWGMGIFTCSFSAQKDLLSQWRGYCGASNGYNIGFKLDELKKFCNKNGYTLMPCVYTRAEQEEMLLPIVTELFAGLLDDPVIADEEERIAKACEQAAYRVRQLAPFLKDPAFSEEEEWRIVVNMYDHRTPAWKVRPGKTSLIPYTDINLMSSSEVFARITVGPGPFNRDKLRFIATQHVQNMNFGINFHVEMSSAPYRYW